jgi:hypothetical protein
VVDPRGRAVGVGRLGQIADHDLVRAARLERLAVVTDRVRHRTVRARGVSNSRSSRPVPPVAPALTTNGWSVSSSTLVVGALATVSQRRP